MSDTKMEVNKEQQKLSRSQQRELDRANQKAQDTFVNLTERLVTYIMDTDSTRPEIEKYASELNKKWLWYCNQKRVNDEAKKMFATWSAKKIDELTDPV